MVPALIPYTADLFVFQDLYAVVVPAIQFQALFSYPVGELGCAVRY